jgi:hypothetical protein
MPAAPAPAAPPPAPVAAPAAPAPAPASPLAAPAAPRSSPLESPELENSFDSAFSPEDGEIEGGPSGEARPTRKPAPAPTARPAEPPKPPVATPKGQKPPVAPTQPDPDALPPEVGESKDLKRVRDFAYQQNKTAKALEKEKTELAARLAQLEAVIPKNEADRKALADRSAAMEKQITDYEDRLRFTDYKQSHEYQTEYLQPYTKAFAKGVDAFGKCQLVYDDPTGKVDEATGAVAKITRQGTNDDLAYLLTLDRPTARREAKKHFPEDWEEVMDHYKTIVPIREKVTEAEKFYKEKGKQIEQEQSARRAQEETQVEEVWNKVNEELETKNPDLKPEEGDVEGSKIFEKANDLTDLFFSEERDKLSVKDRVLMDAHARLRMRTQPLLKHQNGLLKAKIAQLESDLAEIRGSKPGAPKPNSAEPQPTGDDDNGAIAAFDRRM